MKTRPDPIPHGHGVYMLVHRASKSLYIGSSTNLRGRLSEWKSSMLRNPSKYPHLPSHNPDEYEFVLVQQTDGMSVEALRALEHAKIEEARAKGFTLLNQMTPIVKTNETIDGLTMSVTAHATRLGKNAGTVLEKIRKGRTPRQALGLDPYEYDPRKQALGQMPVSLLDRNGRACTYAEAAEITGRSVDALKDWIKRQRKWNPALTKIWIDTTT